MSILKPKKDKQKSPEQVVNENLEKFWKEEGRKLYDSYEEKLKLPGPPERKGKHKKHLDEMLSVCKVLILTANYVEGVTVTRCLINYNSAECLYKIIDGDLVYQFATINDIHIVHVWPRNTSSFTIHGSYNALTAALKRFTPQYVFAVGVAFGADAENQKLGDVLVSSELLFYDAFNKYTDGELKLSPSEVASVGNEILTGCAFLQEDAPGPAHFTYNGSPLGNYMWYKGAMLSGGTVLSDANGKQLLTKAANAIGQDIIGGEMEGIGVYFACKGTENPPSFVIVKGICDWGVNKNGWLFAAKELEKNSNKHKGITKRIKNTVQAYACENAFRTALFMISELKDTLDI